MCLLRSLSMGQGKGHILVTEREIEAQGTALTSIQDNAPPPPQGSNPFHSSALLYGSMQANFSTHCPEVLQDTHQANQAPSGSWRNWAMLCPILILPLGVGEMTEAGV